MPKDLSQEDVAELREAKALTVAETVLRHFRSHVVDWTTLHGVDAKHLEQAETELRSVIVAEVESILALPPAPGSIASPSGSGGGEDHSSVACGLMPVSLPVCPQAGSATPSGLDADWFDQIEDMLDDYSDAEIIDGTTLPNKAMRLLCQLREARSQ